MRKSARLANPRRVVEAAAASLRGWLGPAASFLMVALLVTILASVTSYPATGQSAGQTRSLDMIPVGIEGSGSVAITLPAGYEPSGAGTQQSTWGAYEVTWQDYSNDGTKVVQTVNFPDGGTGVNTGNVIDGIGYGGGVVYFRGNADIAVEAEQNQKPYVKGTIIQEGRFTASGPGGTYPGYFYLSSRTEEEGDWAQGEWEWVYGYYNMAMRIALSDVPPLYTLWVHFWTWGPVDFTDSQGIVYTFTLDGRNAMDAHREYLDSMLSNLRIESWAAVQPPKPTPPPAAPTGTPSQYATPTPVASLPSTPWQHQTPTSGTSPSGTPWGYQTQTPWASPVPSPTIPGAIPKPPMVVTAPQLPPLIVPVFSRADYGSGVLDETPDEARHLTWIVQDGRSGTACVELVLEGANLYWYDRIRSDAWWVYYAMDYIDELESFLKARRALVAQYPELGEDLIPWIERMLQDAVAQLRKRADMLAESLAAAEAAGCYVSPAADDLVYDAGQYADACLSRTGIPDPADQSAGPAEPPPPEEMQPRSIEVELAELDESIAAMEDSLAVRRQVAQGHLRQGQAFTRDAEGLRADIRGEITGFVEMAGGKILAALGDYAVTLGELTEGQKEAMVLASGVAMDLEKGNTRDACLKVADSAVKTYGERASEYVKDFNQAFRWVGLGVDAGYTLSSVATYSEISKLLEAEVDGYSNLVDNTNQEIIELVNNLNAAKSRRAELASQI